MRTTTTRWVAREAPAWAAARVSAPVLALLLALALALVSAGPAPADKDGLSTLAGVWQLDTRASEDPRAMLPRRDTFGEEPEQPEVRRENGRTVRTWSFGGGNRRDRRAIYEELRQKALSIHEGAEVLAIHVEGDTVAMTDWNEVERRWTVDGKRQPASFALAGTEIPVEVEASWRSSDRLVVETTGAPGGKIIEIFEPGNRGLTLFVKTEIRVPKSRLPFVYQRVYHRLSSADDSEGEPSG